MTWSDLLGHSHTASLFNWNLLQPFSSWQEFNWHSMSRGPSAIAVALITHVSCIAACVRQGVQSRLSVGLCSERKTAWTISTKVGRHIVHGRTSACTDPEIKRSNPKPRFKVLTFAMVMGRDAEQCECACLCDCTFHYLLSSQYFKWQQVPQSKLHLPGVVRHVDATAHFFLFSSVFLIVVTNVVINSWAKYML